MNETDINNNKSNNIIILQDENSTLLSPIVDCLGKTHKVFSIPLIDNALDEEILRINEIVCDNKKPFVVIAYSLDAFLAILYAERYAKHVKHIILIGCPSFTNEYEIAIPSTKNSAYIMELLELRKTSHLINSIKKVNCPITFIHGKHDINPYQGVQDVLNENDVDFEFILLDKCGAALWNDKTCSKNFIKLLNVLAGEF